MDDAFNYHRGREGVEARIPGTGEKWVAEAVMEAFPLQERRSTPKGAVSNGKRCTEACKYPCPYPLYPYR